MLPCLTVGSARQDTVEVPTAKVTLRPAVGCWQGRALLVSFCGLLIYVCLF